MKITNQSLIALELIFEKMSNQRLAVRTLYKLSKLSKAVSEEMDFYRSKLRDIINTYCEKDENGEIIREADGVKIIPEHIDACNKEIDELLNLEIELPDIIFTLDELEKLDLVLEDFNKLLPFIEE